MSYTSFGIQDFCPVGTILAYIGSSTTDPPGWVIADGVQRDNSGGIYNNLIDLYIGSGVKYSTYTPDNLKSVFLRGIGIQQSIVNGSSYKTKNPHKLVTHSHTTNALPAHTHIVNPVTGGGSGTSTAPTYGLVTVTVSASGNITVGEATEHGTGFINVINTIGLVVKDTSPGVSVNTVDSNTNETRPFNYAVVWIIKL